MYLMRKRNSEQVLLSLFQVMMTSMLVNYSKMVEILSQPPPLLPLAIVFLHLRMQMMLARSDLLSFLALLLGFLLIARRKHWNNKCMTGYSLWTKTLSIELDY